MMVGELGPDMYPLFWFSRTFDTSGEFGAATSGYLKTAFVEALPTDFEKTTGIRQQNAMPRCGTARDDNVRQISRRTSRCIGYFRSGRHELSFPFRDENSSLDDGDVQPEIG
jgi:hypothetical protein